MKVVCYLLSMTGNDIKKYRQNLKLSKEKFARKLDISLSTIVRWELLEDEEIPSSTMVELALKGLEAQEAAKKAA